MKGNSKFPFRQLFPVIAIICFFVFFGVYTSHLNTKRELLYKDAKTLFDEGNYIDARSAFNQLGNYEESIYYYTTSLQFIKYNEAETFFDEGDYQKSAEIFESLGDFEDSPKRCKEALYAQAKQLFDNGDYENAFGIFQNLNGYKNSDLYIADITLSLQEKMQKRIYNEAQRFFENGDYNSALVELEKIEEYPGSLELKQQCIDMLSRLKLSHTISAGIHGSVAIKTNGGLFFTGGEMATQLAPMKDQDLVSIACFGVVSIGLKPDGHVVTTDLSKTDVHINIDDWDNIIAIDAGRAHIVGLTNEGHVKCTGHNGDGQCNFKDFGDDEFIAVAAGWRHTVALTSTHKVRAIGHINNKHRRDLESWNDKDIVAIAAGGGSVDTEGSGHTVGLTSDGHVVAAGDNDFGQCDVYGDDWTETDIIAIAAGDWHTVGLRADGKVVATGSIHPGEPSAACDVDDWENIVAIDACTGYTLGLTADGTIMATGFDAELQRPDSGDWTDIVVSKEWDTVKHFEQQSN